MKNTLRLSIDPSSRLAAWSETARLSVLIMELLWLTNWYDLLVQPEGSTGLLMLVMGAIMVGTHGLARWMNARKVRTGRRRLVFAGWVVLVLLLSLNWLVYPNLGLSLGDLIMRPIRSISMLQDDLREFWHILLVLVIIWRSLALARESVGILAAQFSFQLGLVMMLFYGIGMGFTKPLQAVLTLYAFLFFSLIAMSAARISTIGDLRGGKLPLPGRKWVTGITLSALVIVGSAVFAGWSSSTWAAEVVLQGYLVLFTILVVIGLVLLSPLILIIFWFSPGLRDLLSELFKGSMLSGVLKFLNSVSDAAQNPPEWLVTGLKIGKPVLLGGTLILVVAGLLLLLVWQPWKQKVQREDLSVDLPVHPILRLPKLLLNRLEERFLRNRRMIAAARIRWVYSQLMGICAALGKPRPPAVTPVEFLPGLLSLFPDQTIELRHITDAYLRVRYGMYPESQAEVDAVEAAWGRIRQAGHPRVAEYKRRLKKGS